MVFGGDRKDRAERAKVREREREKAPEREERDPDIGFLPDLVRRAVERSIQAVLHSEEGRKNLMNALMPRELIGAVVQQVDHTKRDAVAMIGREMQSFLQTLNVGEELRKILTSVSFEIKTEVRFIPNEDGTLSSEIKASAKPSMQRAGKRKGKGGARGKQAAEGADAKAPGKKPRRKQAPAAGPTPGDMVRAAADGTRETVRAAAAGTRKTMRRVVNRVGEAAADLAEAVGTGGDSRDD